MGTPPAHGMTSTNEDGVMTAAAWRGRTIVRRTAAVAATIGGLWTSSTAIAVVAPQGDVSPAPAAAGGNVAAPFRIGNTGYGSLVVNLTGGATPLTVTGGSVIFGDAATGEGLGSFAGFGSNLTTAAAGADLTIGNSGRATVTLSDSARFTISDDLFIANGASSTGSLFVSGFGSLVDVDDTLLVGSGGQALVQVSGGGRLTGDESVLGQLAGSAGSLTVSGVASNLTQSNSITIGDAGRGEFQVQSQATATTTNALVGNAGTATGVVVITGAGAKWTVNGFMNLAVAGYGKLDVVDGGAVTTTGALRMATVAGSESHVIVSGATSVVNIGTTVNVGELGLATFDVRNSARVASTSVVIADNSSARGEVLVDGVGSSWRITGTLDVSEPGEGQLAITSGGLVSATGVVRIAAAGRLLMSTGRLEAGGAGLTNNGIIQGTGRIVGNVNNTATGKIRLGVGNSMIMANALTNSGLVDMEGSELEVLGAVTNNADIDLRNATLRTGGTGLDNNSGAQVAITAGTVDVYGAVDNNVGGQVVVGGEATVVFHDALVNNGQFFVFPDADVLALENLSFTPSSMLSLQLNVFEDQEEPAQVQSAGEAELGGALAVTLAPGYTPGLGDSFEVLTAAGGVSGTFASAALPTLAGGLFWDLDYEPNNVTLSVIDGLAADFDSNGVVNAADLALWKTGFGTATGAMKTDGDADKDGDTDGADFLIWQRQLGSSLLATATAAVVPEPATFGLASVLVGVLCLRRRGPGRTS
jgi:T5SS/PEP-CTERM-associated repeat protein